MKQWICFVLLSTASFFAVADVPTWQIVPGGSSIRFTATQNNAPVNGQFKTFTGDIVGDPNQLDTFKIKIIVDVGSISDPYNQLAETLKDKDWFNTAMFPKATFVSNKIVKTGDKSYQAIGTLTIRDKTVPVTLNFTQEEYTPAKGRIKGSTTLKRTAFGVGQGDWADTKAVKDDVLVEFEVSATKK